AGTTFTLQQDSRAAVRDLRDQIKNLQHGLAFAHDILEVVPLLERALKLDVLFFGTAPSHRGPYVGEKLLVVPRFLYEVRGSRLHGSHRVFYGAVSCNHDYGQARVVRANLRENLHAVAARQRQIEQDEIVGTVSHLRQA